MTRPSPTKIVVILIGVVLAVLYVIGKVAGHPATCDELTAEILTMTGANASEPFDAERVQDLNRDRDDLGCP